MPGSKCRHGLQICSKCIQVTDAARRMSGTINSILAFTTDWWGLRSRWLAFRLQDGSYDGAVYDTREDAIRHQSDPSLCAFFGFRTAMGGANPRDCQIFLNVHRQARESNLQLSEPEAPQLIVPTRYHDFLTGRNRG